MLQRRLARAVPAIVLSLGVALIAAFAVVSLGYPVKKLDLHDSGIWVTNDVEHQFGRINKSASGLDAWLDAPGAAGSREELDVLQDGGAIVQYDAATAGLVPMDSSAVTNSNDNALQLAPGARADLRGGTVAAIEPTAGKVWAARFDPRTANVEIRGLDPQLPALAELGAAPVGVSGQPVAVSVGADGTVHAASANGKLVTIPIEGDGFGPPIVTDFKATLKGVQVAAVGSVGVVYDAESGLVYLPTGPKQVEADPQGRIQQGGPAAPSVLFATSNGLFRITLSDSVTASVHEGAAGTPAAPVRLAGCDFGAFAGTTGKVVRSCNGAPAEELQVVRNAGPLIRPIFRVNRNSLVLNDSADGRVFDLETQARLDNWNKVKPKTSDKPTDPTEEQSEPSLKESKPVAVADTVGVRPDRTTIGYLLDNDTDSLGNILMIEKVTGVPEGVRVQVTPSGQAITIETPRNARSFSFRYTISNGYNADEGNVSVQVKTPEQNDKPTLRPHFKELDYSVASFGTLPISVTGEWRDPEGDPVILERAEISGDDVPVTTEGRIEYTAGREDSDSRKKLTYHVTDGGPESVGHALTIKVLKAKSLVGAPPVALPDTARGEVNQPISFNPLSNDVPGSDPRTPDARLQLAGPLKPQSGLTINTDESSGQITVTASKPGPYFLDYAAAFGGARVSKSRIRLDVTKGRADLTPVAMPDRAAIRGTGAVRVDAIANDSDPAGSLLTVQSVDADPNLFDVSVIGGRWVMVTPKLDDITPNPRIIHYTVSNGHATAVGDISITQLPKAKSDQPLVKDDLAVVRDADSVLVDALENDVSPSGERLGLTTNLVGQPTVGQLVVYDPTDSSGSNGDPAVVGQAFINGDKIRYVAPAGLTEEREVIVEYLAQTPDGTRSGTGKVRVTVRPQPADEVSNRAPAPELIEARVVAGARMKFSLPISGQDPDGDSVFVVGIGSGPKLGRIVGASPTSVTYEAYPTDGNAGTDAFTVVVRDRYGKTGEASVRVGVTPPGAPQPPVAIEDNVIADFGSLVRIDVRANDLYSKSDKVTVAPLEDLNEGLPAGARLNSPEGPLSLQAPGANDQPVILQYALAGNGGTGAPTTIKLVSEKGYENPPVVFDEVAVAAGQQATVDVLRQAWDPDGNDADLTVKLLGGPPESAVNGHTVSIPMTGQPQVIPYQVTDSSGAVSAALIFVPSNGTGAPHLKAGGLIRVDRNGSATLALPDYVTSPRGRDVRFTLVDTLSGSPAGNVELTAVDSTHFTVTAKNDYIGPGAVTMQVMDAASATDPDVLMAYVTIPVQVGPETPVLRCPDYEVELLAGGREKSLDIASLCNVWTANPAEAEGLKFTAAWSSPAVNDVRIQPGHNLVLQAGGGAPPNSRGELRIGVEGFEVVPQTIKVKVVPAPPPTMRGRRFTDIKQGTPVRVPLGVSSPLADAEPGVVRIEQLSGPASTSTVQGTMATIRPDANVDGVIRYRVTATDVADKTRRDRWVTAIFELVVYGVPDAPKAPRPGKKAQSHSETLTWGAPQANGAAITQYEVRVNPTGKRQICASTQCRITGLQNNVPVSFQVRASNKAGWGDWSSNSVKVTPDEAPPAPTGLKVSNPLDRRVTLSWNAVKVDGSPVHTFHINVDGRHYAVSGSRRSYTVPLSDNNSIYTIQLSAENNYDIGPASSIRAQSAGKPLGLRPPTLSPSDLIGAVTALTVRWNQADKNGPADLTYTVVRDGAKTICSGVRTTSCVDDSVTFNGAIHSYKVTATNGAGGPEHSSVTQASWKATGTPDRPAVPTVTATGSDRQLRVQGTAPDSRGSAATLRILANGGVVRTMPVSPRGQSIDQQITVGSDGVAYNVTLQVCNETRCGPASGGDTATPYGPIQSFTLDNGSANGTSVSFRINVNPNGRPLNVSVNGNRIATTGQADGIWRQAVTRDLGGYGRSQTFTVVVSDGSRSQTRQITLRSEDPPPPVRSVSVSRGPLHQVSTCTAWWCAEVVVTTKGFGGTVTCRISDSDMYGAWGSSWTQGGNTTHNSQKIYGGYWIEVTCDGVTGRNSNWYP